MSVQKSWIAVFLSLFLIIPLPVSRAVTATSTATITFLDGCVEFAGIVEAEINSLDFSFGLQDLPRAAQDYANLIGDRCLEIHDARHDGATGDWRVDVSINLVSLSTSALEGIVVLKNPVPTASFGDITGKVTTDSVVVRDSTQTVMETTMGEGGSRKGTYQLAWTTVAEGSGIRLLIDETNANGAAQGEPSAAMTWTLVFPAQQ